MSSAIDPSFREEHNVKHEQGESVNNTGSLDPEMAAAAIAMANVNTHQEADESKEDSESGPDSSGLGMLHHGRPLTNTKRAAQNRAAQRAFRERRKAKLKELEVRAQQHEKCEAEILTLKRENDKLKDYILTLQAKLLDAGVPVNPMGQQPENGAHGATGTNGSMGI